MVATNLALTDNLNKSPLSEPQLRSDRRCSNRSAAIESPDYYVVDNAILANVNVKDDSFFGAQTGSIRFNKSQEAEIDGSFNDATGVSNVNSAAGNLNKPDCLYDYLHRFHRRRGRQIKKFTSY